MSDVIELNASEVAMVAGGRLSLALAVQTNINVNPQTAVAIAVLSPNARVGASNHSIALQLNLAALA